MILAYSTSSPLAGVAAIDDAGQVAFAESRLAPGKATETIAELTRNLLADRPGLLDEVHLVVADLGPGSFTGVKIGVTAAKVMAELLGVKCAGASAFDLISADGLVAIPTRKGEWIVRTPGHEPERVEGWPEGAIGYGSGVAEPEYPSVERFAVLLALLEPVEPHQLLPLYGSEPSISVPKKPFVRWEPSAT